ncbi:MAG: hypothetical protein ACJ746_16715 [Bryobacteraceae bacterium]
MSLFTSLSDPRSELRFTDSKRTDLDGAGNPWFYGDIAVRGDTIAFIGHLPEAKATLAIDAKGLAVAPGFIDIHSHGRRGIFQVPSAANYLQEGVTTLLKGRTAARRFRSVRF